MKLFYLLFISSFILFSNACKAPKKSQVHAQKDNSDTLEMINNPFVLMVQPTEADINQMKKEMGEDFYIMADDVMWYQSEMITHLDSLKIETRNTEDKNFSFRNEAKKVFSLKAKITEPGWHYFYFDGKTLVEKNTFDLSNLKR